jgi:hypothetical protein
MTEIIDKTAGWKTYALAGAFTAWAVFGWAFELHDANTAIEIIQTSGLGATLRHALARL